MKFFYVYILQSESVAAHFYVGFTEDLQKRLNTHNAGEVSHTAKFCPWRIKTAIAFTCRERAAQFERHLKTASGQAFAKKRLCVLHFKLQIAMAGFLTAKGKNATQ